MGKRVVMVIAPEGFRDEELFEPKEELEKAGHKVVVASRKTKIAKGMLGATVPTDLDVNQVKLSDFDAIVFVGGSGSVVYHDDKYSHGLLREAKQAGKIVAGICMATGTLANAGVLEGNATGWPTEKDKINAHAKYTGKPVEVAAKGRVITGYGPQAAREFGRAIAKALA